MLQSGCVGGLSEYLSGEPRQKVVMCWVHQEGGYVSGFDFRHLVPRNGVSDEFVAVPNGTVACVVGRRSRTRAITTSWVVVRGRDEHARARSTDQGSVNRLCWRDTARMSPSPCTYQRSVRRSTPSPNAGRGLPPESTRRVRQSAAPYLDGESRSERLVCPYC